MAKIANACARIERRDAIVMYERLLHITLPIANAKC